MKLRKYIKSLGTISFITFPLLLNGCDITLLHPKGQVAMEQRSLILTAFCLMLIVVIPAVTMALLFAWKYRSTNKHAKYSPNWSHSNKIEIIVWSIPILIILILGILTWKSTHALEPSKPLICSACYKSQPIEIDVVSLDWKWLFIYPQYNIATVNQISFPVNTPVIFKITSNSVMNSFFIPALGSQIYAMAGMQTKLNLIANEPGKFDGISSNFSGSGFSGMKFKAIVTKDKAGFQRWINTVKMAHNKLMNMDDFEKIALPSENNSVKYFSTANPELFKQVIHKFMERVKKSDLIPEQKYDHSLHRFHKN